MMDRTQAMRRARSYSKRHRCEVRVEHVVKGRAKGCYETVEDPSCPLTWWADSVVEVVAIYRHGRKI